MYTLMFLPQNMVHSGTDNIFREKKKINVFLEIKMICFIAMFDKEPEYLP